MFVGKLRAFLSPLVYGEHGVFLGTSKLVHLHRFSPRVRSSNFSRFTSTFSRGGGGSFKSRGTRILHRTLHSTAKDDFSESDEPKQEDREGCESPGQKLRSCLEDDDWSELGSVKEDGIVIPKLLTEKPERFRKTNGKRKAADPNLKGLSSKPSSSSPTTGQKIKTQNSDSSSITVLNVPSSVAHSQLRLAISSFGKISKVSTKRNLDGSNIYEIDFEDVESRKQALAAGHVSLKNANLEIQPGEAGHVVRIRISNLNLETADSAIHSRCMSFGSLEGLARVDEDVVDALFRVRDSSEADFILDKLNNTTVDDFHWSAKLQSRIPTPAAAVTKPEASQDQMGLRISSCTEDLQRQKLMHMVHVEDLEILIHSILHLENHPITSRD